MGLPLVDIYTDGSCSPNPGRGGWAAILCFKETEKEVWGSEASSTNNRMELMAAIQGLASLSRGCAVNLYTDSTYVKNGITQWIHNWEKNNWKTAARKDVKNADLWQDLKKSMSKHEVRWHWVKAHAGHVLNERADALARAAQEQRA